MPRLLLYCCFLLLPFTGFAQRWIPAFVPDYPHFEAFQGPTGGADVALSGPGGVWMVGGFNELNGTEWPWSVARYTGDQWDLPDLTSVPSDLSAPHCAVLWNEAMYIGHVSDWNSDVIRWSETAGWQDLGAETDGVVLAMAASSSHLYIAGSFSELNGESCGIARYDGTNWEVVHPPLDGNVWGMAWHNDALWVGGSFSNLNEDISFLGRYQWGVWSEPENTVTSTVRKLELSQGELFILGGFDEDSNGDPLIRIARVEENTLQSITNEPAPFTGPPTAANFWEGQLLVSRNSQTYLPEQNWESFTVGGALEEVSWNGTTYLARHTVNGADEHRFWYDESSLLYHLNQGQTHLPFQNDSLTIWLQPGGMWGYKKEGLPGFYFTPDADTTPVAIPGLMHGSTVFSGTEGTQVYATADQFGNDIDAVDFATVYGPISQQYDRSYTDCYFRVWAFTQADIEAHLSNYAEPGYAVPEMLASYPGNGRVEHGESPHLLPFHDQNQNGWYEPELGDYPSFCSDRAAFWIFNDRNTHPASVGMGLEIIGSAHMTAGNNAHLNRAVFFHFEVRNRSGRDYSDARFGVHSHALLGDFTDNRIGCHPEDGLYFYYNGDSWDEEFESEVPVVAVGFPEDSLDAFLFHEIALGPGDTPDTPEGWDYFLQGRWNNGAYLLPYIPYYTSDELDPDIVHHSYPSYPWEDGWSELNPAELSIPGYRFGISGTHRESFNDATDQSFCFWHFAARYPNLSPVESLQEMANAESALDAYANEHICGCQAETFPLSIETHSTLPTPWVVYPNPASDWIKVHSNFPLHPLEILTLQGQTVARWNPLEQRTFSLDALQPGTYLVVNSEDGSANRLIISP